MSEPLRLTAQDLADHQAACALPTDAERQDAFRKVSDRVRLRNHISPRRFFSWKGNTIIIDTKRERIPPVNKISKSP